MVHIFVKPTRGAQLFSLERVVELPLTDYNYAA